MTKKFVAHLIIIKRAILGFKIKFVTTQRCNYTIGTYHFSNRKYLGSYKYIMREREQYLKVIRLYV